MSNLEQGTAVKSSSRLEIISDKAVNITQEMHGLESRLSRLVNRLEPLPEEVEKAPKASEPLGLLEKLDIVGNEQELTMGRLFKLVCKLEELVG